MRAHVRRSKSGAPNERSPEQLTPEDESCPGFAFGELQQCPPFTPFDYPSMQDESTFEDCKWRASIDAFRLAQPEAPSSGDKGMADTDKQH
jgi:hypothetical protein